MSETDKTPTSSGLPDAPERRRRGMRNRLHRFFFRHVPLAIAGVVALLALLAVGAYFVASSTGFENLVRRRLIAQIENSTGGRVEIGSFHWRLLHLEAEAGGLVIHGLEDPGDVPYAQIERLRVQLSVFGFLSPRILLHDLEITRPSLHLVIYPDGSTNQPHPHYSRKSTRPALDTLFDLEASHVQVEQGGLEIDNRAAAFDYQNRYAPLDFEASDVSLVMRYLAAPFSGRLYRIEAGAADFNLTRNPLRKKPPPVRGHVQFTLDLEPERISLRDLQVSAQSPGSADRTLVVTGVLDDLTHPRWQARATGDLDMRLLDPVVGYPDAPEGIAHLDLSAGGAAGTFHINGPVHVDGGAYVGAGISAKGITLDARIDADPKQLQITQIVARLRQGGQIEGAISLQPWLPGPTVATEQVSAGGSEGYRSSRNVLVRPMDVSIPVNGKVNSSFKDVSLDTVLDIVSVPQYRRLGLDALLNGPAVAAWTNGDAGSILVTANFGLSRSSRSPAGEAPTNGVIDATYTQRTGAVELRKLELHLPDSDIEASGALGAYPVTSSSAINVDFHSHNLGEFDAVLRSLGLERNGKTGTAALPVALTGQADFHGSWTGSLVRPHLTGAVKANQLAIEVPAASGGENQPQFERLDSVEVTGSYSPSQIAIEHAQLLRGKTRIALNGSLDATPGQAPAIAGSRRRGRRVDEPEPNFDSGSVLHAHVEAANVDTSDVQSFVAADARQRLPLEGLFNARIEANGPLRALSASGSVEMDDGVFYGEPLKHLRVQAAVADQAVKVTSATLSAAAGTVSASGSYDLKAKTFQIDAHGAGIDISRIAWINRHELETAGKLGISITGSGTLDDPRIEAHAAASSLTLGGQQFGALEVAAHAANHKASYDLTTQLEGADLTVRGETNLIGDYGTNAKLDFSRFNIGALFGMAHVDAFGGESSLAGTVTVAGPLAHPEQLYGDARLQDLTVTVAGVKLQSEGGVHATLANDRIHLDPLHVTGEETDLRAQGSVSLEGVRQLDIAASGSVNLKLAETLDPDVTAAGVTTFQVEAHGPLQHPELEGRVDFEDGSLSLEGLPNGLSQLRGELQFNQNRLEVKSLTAMSGGGLLSLGGSLAYEHGIYADLSVTGKQVHIRYPEGVSSLADAKLQLQGSQNNLQLSGDVLITRFSVNPDLDLAALALQANASMQSVAPPQAPSNHVRLDVQVSSSPQLNFQNAYAKLAGDVNLHLRGTLASPSLLGQVAITEGSATIAGTRYDLQRGEITFTNPVRIEPVIDLSATAHVEDYDISLGLNGPLQKLGITYRSDPPLPEADVLSLLALGHTANQQRLYTQQQEQSITNPTDAILGGALNATVSNRVQKLFGAGSVKVDPNYLGAFGNSTSRITVEEQFGRIITLTYATDVNTTSQQLLQAEVAINRHVSFVVARDESGVFSMVIKYRTTRR